MALFQKRTTEEKKEIKKAKRTYHLINLGLSLLTVVLIFILLNSYGLNINNIISSKDKLLSDIKSYGSANLCIGGNIFFSPINTKNKDEFSETFRDIEKYISESDLSIANLNILDDNFSEDFASNLKNVGFDIFNTSTRYSLNCKNPKESNIDILSSLELSQFGIKSAQNSNSDILIKQINGLNIAFLSYTIPNKNNENNSLINTLDKNLVKSDISTCINNSCDFIFAFIDLNNSDDEYLSDFLFSSGVDFIIFNNPNKALSVETSEHTMPDGTTKRVFLANSLGNVVSDDNYTNASILLNLTISKNESGKCETSNLEYIPIYSNINNPTNRILDIYSTLENYEENGEISLKFHRELSDILGNLRDTMKNSQN